MHFIPRLILVAFLSFVSQKINSFVTALWKWSILTGCLSSCHLHVEKMWSVLANRKQRRIRKHHCDTEEHPSACVLHVTALHNTEYKNQKGVHLVRHVSWRNQSSCCSASLLMPCVSLARVRKGTLRDVRMSGLWSSITTHSGLTWVCQSMLCLSWPLSGDHQLPGLQTWAQCWCIAGRQMYYFAEHARRGGLRRQHSRFHTMAFVCICSLSDFFYYWRSTWCLFFTASSFPKTVSVLINRWLSAFWEMPYVLG